MRFPLNDDLCSKLKHKVNYQQTGGPKLSLDLIVPIISKSTVIEHMLLITKIKTTKANR